MSYLNFTLNAFRPGHSNTFKINYYIAPLIRLLDFKSFLKYYYPVTQALKVVKNRMPEVKVGENESIEVALRRFKKKIQKAGILSEVKKRERYEKPSVKRKRKSEAARKRKS